ncbi:unnamed protein product [Rhizophagus irregularis]|nr:unnamed protein product [Rhizophagus irregularis]
MPELVEVNICNKIINNIKAERYNTQLRSQNANNIKFGRSHSKKNETIGELKRRIKAEKDYFDTIGASDLRLWRTNTRIGSNNAIPCFDLSDSNEILSYFEIKDIWKEDPPKSNLHVVIKIEERNVGELKSMIKKRWKPLFSHIVSNKLKLMAINIPPNQVITYEEDKCVMKNLDKIKSVFANSIYNYNPDHLHVMISSDTWKEVHCKAIYKKTIYEKHEKQFQWKITHATVTLVKLKDKLRKYFSELHNIAKQSINLYRTHDGNTLGEFIRSDSMLERIMWGKFYRIDNSYIYVQKIEPRNVRMINNFHEVFYFNIRRNRTPKNEKRPLETSGLFSLLIISALWTWLFGISALPRFRLLICESLTEDGTYGSWLLICESLMEDSTHWPRLLICESLTKDGTHGSRLLICKSLTEDGTYGSRFLICKSLTEDGTRGSRLLICESLTEDGTYGSQFFGISALQFEGPGSFFDNFGLCHSVPHFSSKVPVLSSATSALWHFSFTHRKRRKEMTKRL